MLLTAWARTVMAIFQPGKCVACVINYCRLGNFHVKNISQVKFLWHYIFVVLGNHKTFEWVISSVHIKMELCERGCCVGGYHVLMAHAFVGVYPVESIANYMYLTLLLLAVHMYFLYSPLVSPCSHCFCHFAVHSLRKNGKQKRSLGLRKPIFLFTVSKKSHHHSLATAKPV